MSARDSDPFKHRGGDRSDRGDGGDPLVSAYRAVSAEEDARPPSATREAILAAAARAVQSRPQPVAPGDAPSVAQGAYASWPGESRRGRWRMPLALAATLMIGVIGWQLAAMFDSAPPADMSEAGTATSGAMTTPSEKAVTPPETATASPRTEVAPASPPAAAQKPAPAPASAKPAPPPGAGARTERAPAVEKPVAPSVQAVPVMPPPPAPSPAPPPPPPAASGAATAAPAANADAAAPSAMRPAEVERARREEGATAGSAERRPKAAPPDAPSAAAEQQVRTLPVDRRRFDEPAARRPLNAWIARVAELRAAGRHAEAQTELQALLRAYPDADLPPEVWPRGAPALPAPSPSSSDPPAN